MARAWPSIPDLGPGREVKVEIHTVLILGHLDDIMAAQPSPAQHRWCIHMPASEYMRA